MNKKDLIKPGGVVRKVLSALAVDVAALCFYYAKRSALPRQCSDLVHFLWGRKHQLRYAALDSCAPFGS